MISIVLPVYNGEKYLRQSIESILNQTYKEIELIIVNDCSTDKSWDIINEYLKKDSRIKLINNKVNQKLPRSLNIGFANAKGEYYTWTSDDNIMMPMALEEMLAVLEAQQVDLVFSRCAIIDEYGKRIGKTEIYNNLNEIYYNNIVLASFLYRKKVHEDLKGYDTNKFLVEDYDFWLRAYKKFKFSYINEILYEIRFHGDNLGNKYSGEVKLRKINLLKENLQHINEDKIVEEINKEICNCYYSVSSEYYIKLKNNKSKKIINNSIVKDLVKRILNKGRYNI